MPRSLSVPMLVVALALAGLAVGPGSWRNGPVMAAGPGQMGSLGLVAQLGGATKAVSLQGTRSVAGMGAALVVVDTAGGGPAAVLGQVTLPGVVQGLAVGPRYAYVAATYAGLQVVDLVDPRTPRVVGSLVDAEGAEAWDVFLDGGRVYLAERSDVDDRISAVDVANPAAPRVLGSYSPLASGIVDADVRAGVAYLVDGEALVTVSFADPAAPRELVTYDTPDQAGGVSVAAGKAYVLDTAYDDATQEYTDNVRVMDVADPAAPVEVGAYKSPGIVRDLSAVGNRVYVLESEVVRMLDVSDPAHPAERGTLVLPGGPLAVGVDGNRLAVGLATGGLAFVDATDPAAARVTATWVVPGSPHDLALAGDQVLQIEKAEVSGVRLVGVVNPAQPLTEGYVTTPGEAKRIAAQGRYAFVADGLSGLRVVDAVDPASPQLVGSYDLARDAMGVTVVGDRLYLAAGRDGLGILDVADPTKPSSLGGFNVPGEALGVVVAGDRAFVAEVDMVRALDVSDPRLVRFLGAIAIEPYEGNMALAGDRLYLPTADGLVVADVSNPAAMREVGRVAIDGGANDVAVDGGRAWVTSPAGVHEIDLARLAVTAEYFTPAYAEGLAVRDGLVYVAAYEAGLYVVAASVPGTPPPPTATAGGGTRATPSATATAPSGRTPTSATPSVTPARMSPTPTVASGRYRAFLPVAYRK
jgi:hypothetical protein